MLRTTTIANELAAIERKLKETDNVTLKEALKKKQARLKEELKDPSKSASQLAKILLSQRQAVKALSKVEFNDLIRRLSKKPEYSFLKSMPKGVIKNDLQVTAKPVGWRFKGRGNYDKPTKAEIAKGKKSGTVYREVRPRRSDVSQVVKLANGGGIENSYLIEIKGNAGNRSLKIIDGDSYKIFNNSMPYKIIENVSEQNFKQLIDKIKSVKPRLAPSKYYSSNYAQENGIFLSFNDNKIEVFSVDSIMPKKGVRSNVIFEQSKINQKTWKDIQNIIENVKGTHKEIKQEPKKPRLYKVLNEYVDGKITTSQIFKKLDEILSYGGSFVLKNNLVDAPGLKKIISNIGESETKALISKQLKDKKIEVRDSYNRELMLHGGSMYADGGEIKELQEEIEFVKNDDISNWGNQAEKDKYIAELEFEIARIKGIKKLDISKGDIIETLGGYIYYVENPDYSDDFMWVKNSKDDKFGYTLRKLDVKRVVSSKMSDGGSMYAEGGGLYDYKIGDFAWIRKHDYNEEFGEIIDIRNLEMDINLGQGIKGSQSEIYATIVDEKGKEHSGQLMPKNYADGGNVEKSKIIKELNQLLEYRNKQNIGSEEYNKYSERITNLKNKLVESSKMKEGGNISEKYCVVMSGGSIGSKGMFDKKGRKLVEIFETREEAAAYAKRRNSQLSPGEKSYYKMKYYISPYNEKDFISKMAKGGLVGNQHKLDINKNGRIDSEDLAMLRNNKMAKGGYLEGREEYEGYNYQIWYNPRKDMYSVSDNIGVFKGDNNYFDMYDQAKEHAEISIRSMLESEEEMAKGGILEKESLEMINNQAKSASHHINELQGVLKSNPNIEPWVVAKMQRATTDLADITHYLDGKDQKMHYGGGVEADYVVFSVNDDSLDTLLNDFHSRELDYVDIDGDSYYKLNKRDFDRFIDAADSRGFDVDYENSEDSVIYVQENMMAKGGSMYANGGKIGSHIVFRDMRDEVREGDIIDVLPNGGYEVRVGFGTALVLPNEVISFKDKMSDGGSMYADGGGVDMNKKILSYLKSMQTSEAKKILAKYNKAREEQGYYGQRPAIHVFTIDNIIFDGKKYSARVQQTYTYPNFIRIYGEIPTIWQLDLRNEGHKGDIASFVFTKDKWVEVSKKLQNSMYGDGGTMTADDHYKEYLRYKGLAEQLLNSYNMPSKYDEPKPGTIQYETGKKQMEYSDKAQEHYSKYLALQRKMGKGGSTKKQREKVGKVMHEFKAGKLHSGSKKGPIVKDRDQAIAIALSEAGMSKKMAKGGRFDQYYESKWLTKEQWEKWNEYVKTGKIDGKKENNIFAVARWVGAPVARISAYEIEQRSKKMAKGGGVGRQETQKNNFGVTYKLGDKFFLNDMMSSKLPIETTIVEILPSGLFFKVDKSSKVFSIKTLHSKGSSYTSGQYLIINKMSKGGLMGDQHKLDVNKNGKIDSEDLAKLRGEMAKGGIIKSLEKEADEIQNKIDLMIEDDAEKNEKELIKLGEEKQAIYRKINQLKNKKNNSSSTGWKHKIK